MAREPKKAKIRKIDICKERIVRYRELILNGSVLAIDPSCGSSSMPGYCIYRESLLIEQGWINIKKHADLTVRLRRLAHALETEFESENFDVVIIEDPASIPLYSKAGAEKKGKTYMSPQAVNSLARAVGVTVAAFAEQVPIIMMSPLLWYHTARKEGWLIDKKDDEDAAIIGRTAILIAKGVNS